jgi:hypothetical protein
MWDFFSDPPLWFWLVMGGLLVGLIVLLVVLRRQQASED